MGFFRLNIPSIDLFIYYIETFVHFVTLVVHVKLTYCTCTTLHGAISQCGHYFVPNNSAVATGSLERPRTSLLVVLESGQWLAARLVDWLQLKTIAHLAGLCELTHAEHGRLRWQEQLQGIWAKTDHWDMCSGVVWIHFDYSANAQ